MLPAPEMDTTCRAGVYVRLSVEDKHTRTASIETQQLIIARYLEQNPEIIVVLPLSRRLGSRAVELLVEELAVDPPGNRDAAGFRQFLVHLPDELVGVGPRHAQLVRHLVYPDKLVFHAGSSFLE